VVGRQNADIADTLHQRTLSWQLFFWLSTLCLKKVSTFLLSVTLSNLNRFSKFLHCWKAYEICYKTYLTLLTSP